MDQIPPRGHFLRYERVRVTGRSNMMSDDAVRDTGLSQSEYMAVLQNYGALRAMYPEIVEIVRKELDRHKGNIPTPNKMGRQWRKHTF